MIFRPSMYSFLFLLINLLFNLPTCLFFNLFFILFFILFYFLFYFCFTGFCCTTVEIRNGTEKSSEMTLSSFNTPRYFHIQKRKIVFLRASYRDRKSFFYLMVCYHNFQNTFYLTCFLIINKSLSHNIPCIANFARFLFKD